MEGACLPADSRREIALLVVPIRSATASCVRPARERALSIWSASWYSSASASYASAKPLRFDACAMNDLCSCTTGLYVRLAMLQLLGPFTGQLEFFVRSLLGFLDKSVNNDDPIAMKEAIKCAANARVATRSEEHPSELQSLMSITYAVF